MLVLLKVYNEDGKIIVITTAQEKTPALSGYVKQM